MNTRTPVIQPPAAESIRPKLTLKQMPANARKEYYSMFREHARDMLQVLLDIAHDEDADKGNRIQAAKEILSRGLGQAPNVNIVEATLKHEVSLNTDALRQMPEHELSMLQSTLARLIGDTGDKTIEHETPNESTEHAISETPNESASHAPNESTDDAPTPPRRRRRV